MQNLDDSLHFVVTQQYVPFAEPVLTYIPVVP